MRMALREAVKGAGQVSPNPLVGAVAVKNGEVLAKAYHRKFGDLHAETALLGKLTPEQAYGSTIYVNLEPCCHVGKTAPCTTALIDARVKRVVIGLQDPNPLVNGKGMSLLRNAGIDVVSGVCESEARRLNAPFLTYIEKQRPWLLLKVAQSLDGRIALASGASRWITGEPSRQEVHRLRAQLDAVLIGVLTVIDDDPELTVRHVKGRDPVRIIADSRLRIPATARVLRQPNPERTWILTTSDANPVQRSLLENAGVVLINCARSAEGKVDMTDAMRKLATRGITSILVEGGGTVHAALLGQELYDELIVAVAPILIGSDGRASVGALALSSLGSAPRFRTYRHATFGEDHWFYLERDVYGHR
ncbi:MAG: bifunctional diaminohydroxyphosphoribosylaminopyrimidine deaminase/5-amino-6-(5-phosphoribosylamino)uracil reductase RibD [bacterium]|nr:bifunctional diaminohydroxyphosphoribosylaminopyrimidine deaminase/5-amino-6-(5-phosphoribosylamino)uracil reductase RibD [bacterium]